MPQASSWKSIAHLHRRPVLQHRHSAPLTLFRRLPYTVLQPAQTTTICFSTSRQGASHSRNSLRILAVRQYYAQRAVLYTIIGLHCNRVTLLSLISHQFDNFDVFVFALATFLDRPDASCGTLATSDAKHQSSRLKNTSSEDKLPRSTHPTNVHATRTTLGYLPPPHLFVGLTAMQNHGWHLQ